MSERPTQSAGGEAKKPVPVTRLARVVARGWDKTRNGDPQYVVVWEICRGPTEGTRVVQRLGWSEKQAKWTWRALRQLGWRGTDLTTLDAGAIVAEHAIEITQRQDGDKTFVDVRIVDWSPRPPPASVIATLTATTASARAEADRELGITPAAAPTGQREPGDDDDDAPADDPFS